jgi:hypothetical protein
MALLDTEPLESMVSVYVDESPYPSHSVVDESDPGCDQIICGHPETRMMSVNKPDLAIM